MFFIFADMDVPVFFLPHFSADNILTLNEDTSRHVVQVLRMKPSERLQLTDGAGNSLTAEVLNDHKKNCTVRVIERKFIGKKQQQVCIAISLLKNASRFEWFLEKATEIGVTEIVPLICERTEKQQFKAERMRQITISAMMQSKQVWLPVLHPPVVASKAIFDSNYSTKLMAHCEEGEKNPIVNFRQMPSVQIFIGPEGDFSHEEIGAALQAGFVPVNLGNNRYRTETAG
ncbi:MAG TPA: RsmE family RNA methyltransferase, partial [Segetibacter sp.]